MQKWDFKGEEPLRADSALTRSDVVTLGRVGEGIGGVWHMHLVYVARQLDVGVVSGEQGRQRE